MTPKSTAPVFILTLSALLAGCATPEAPDLSGRWRPVNRFAETPQAIVLQQSYVFYASPLDGTLKRMLERWASDSGMTLIYYAPMDYTLHKPVANFRASSIDDAIAHLNGAYAAQKVTIATEGNHLVVRVAEDPAPPAASDAGRP